MNQFAWGHLVGQVLGSLGVLAGFWLAEKVDSWRKKRSKTRKVQDPPPEVPND